MRLATDFDGTVADTMGALEDLASEVVQAHSTLPGHVVRSQYRATAGMPFTQQLQHMALAASARRAAAAEFEERKVAVTLRSRPFEDAAEALQLLHAGGVEVVVVSSTATDLVHLWLRRWELARYVHQVYGLSYGSKLQQLQRCRPRGFVGDTKWDAVKATEAGVTFLGVHRSDALLSESDSVGSSFVEIAKSYLAGASVGGAVAKFLDGYGLEGVRFEDPE